MLCGNFICILISKAILYNVISRSLLAHTNRQWQNVHGQIRFTWSPTTTNKKSRKKIVVKVFKLSSNFEHNHNKTELLLVSICKYVCVGMFFLTIKRISGFHYRQITFDFFCSEDRLSVWCTWFLSAFYVPFSLVLSPSCGLQLSFLSGWTIDRMTGSCSLSYKSLIQW